MVQDVLRSCYRSAMILYPEHPEILTWGYWYFTEDGADPLPIPHAFGSSVWDDKKKFFVPTVGEVQRGAYYHGQRPPRARGKHYCGPVEYWQQGSPLSARGSLLLDADGWPVCCGDTQVPPGGLSLGADGWAGPLGLTAAALKLGLVGALRGPLRARLALRPRGRLIPPAAAALKLGLVGRQLGPGVARLLAGVVGQLRGPVRSALLLRPTGRLAGPIPVRLGGRPAGVRALPQLVACTVGPKGRSAGPRRVALVHGPAGRMVGAPRADLVFGWVLPRLRPTVPLRAAGRFGMLRGPLPVGVQVGPAGRLAGPGRAGLVVGPDGLLRGPGRAGLVLESFGRLVVMTPMQLVTGVGCEVHNSATQTAFSGFWNTLVFDTPDYDPLGIWEGVAGPSRFKVPTGYAGWWRFGVHLEWAGLSTLATVGVRLLVNGATAVAEQLHQATAATSPQETYNWTLRLAAGDFVEFQAYGDWGVTEFFQAGLSAYTNYTGQ